jgi:hypothetical protein
VFEWYSEDNIYRESKKRKTLQILKGVGAMWFGVNRSLEGQR